MLTHTRTHTKTQRQFAEHPFISVDEAKTMFGPADGSGQNATNWGQNWFGKNLQVHHPKTYEEVAGLVKALRAQGAKLRVLGVMHSWSNVFADDGTHVIYLDNFKSIIQDPNDYTIVTLQAGVTNAELADFADNPNRGYGRFSYLPGNTLVQAVTYIGAAQTASHGSGNAGTCGDFITRMTLIDAYGNIKSVDGSHKDFKVYAACLGMCGIILDATVKFAPETTGVTVTQIKAPLKDFFPRSCDINATYNPLKQWIESHVGGAMNYATYNSAILSGPLDPKKGEIYTANDYCWAQGVTEVPGLQVQGDRKGLPIWGTQHEPFYDKDLFIPSDYNNAEGTRLHRVALGDWRYKKDTPYMPFFGGLVQNSVLIMQPPSFQLKAEYNTSRASSTHFVRYIEHIYHANDYSFALKVDDDYTNIYDAWWALIDINNQMFLEKGQYPMNLYAAIRWLAHSECPLSGAYGQPGDRFVLIEASSAHGTVGWEEFCQRVLAKFATIKNKKDGSLPKPHWGKVNVDWTPDITRYTQEVMGDQLSRVKAAVMEMDPSGMFRNAHLSKVFDMPY